MYKLSFIKLILPPFLYRLHYTYILHKNANRVQYKCTFIENNAYEKFLLVFVEKIAILYNGLGRNKQERLDVK